MNPEKPKALLDRGLHTRWISRIAFSKCSSPKPRAYMKLRRAIQIIRNVRWAFSRRWRHKFTFEPQISKIHLVQSGIFKEKALKWSLSGFISSSKRCKKEFEIHLLSQRLNNSHFPNQKNSYGSNAVLPRYFEGRRSRRASQVAWGWGIGEHTALVWKGWIGNDKILIFCCRIGPRASNMIWPAGELL